MSASTAFTCALSTFTWHVHLEPLRTHCKKGVGLRVIDGM